MFLVAGLCAGISFGTKLNYVHVPVVCAAFALLWPTALPVRDRVSCQFLPLVAGGAIAAAALALYAYPDPEAFLYMFEHHGGFMSTGPRQFPLSKNLEVARAQFTSITVLGALLLAVISQCFRLSKGAATGRSSVAPPKRQWLIWLILLAGIPICLLPTPSHRWYYAPIIPFLFLATASVWAQSGLGVRTTGKFILVGITAIACAPHLLQITRDRTAQLFERTYWTPLAVRDASRRIDQILAEAGLEGRIATLSPALLIDSKHPFYLELSTGPFFFRRTPHMPEEKVKQLHGVSASKLSDLLAADMPAAIFGGHENGLDEPFFEFANEHGYRLVHDDKIGGKLYIRPPLPATQRPQ
jgi:hypothetical protein